MNRSTESDTTFSSFLLWTGIAVFVYLKFHFPVGRPTDLISYIAVGAWVAGGILVAIEAGYSIFRDHAFSEWETGFGAAFLLTSMAFGGGLIWHLINSNQGELLASLFFGGALYLGFIRYPVSAIFPKF